MADIIFYVAPDGDDRWSGQLPTPNPDRTDGPFATLAQARDAIRANKSTLVLQPSTVNVIHVLIRAGKYCLDQTLILGPEDSGTPECPIVYEAYPGEQPVLSGGRVVRDWQTHQGAILKCILPGAKGGKWKFRQLFYSPKPGEPSQHMNRARYPKFDPANPYYGGWAFMEGPADDRSNRAWNFPDGVGWHISADREGGLANVFRCKPGFSSQRWSKPSEGEVHVFLGFGWGFEIIPIRTYDDSAPDTGTDASAVCPPSYRTITLQRDILQWDRAQWFTAKSFAPNLRFYVANLLEELTEPGEWCLDSEDGLLYFWPPDSQAPIANIQPSTSIPGDVIAPLLSCLISLRGASYITLSGLTFTETDGGDDILREDGDGYGPFYPRQGLRYCGEALHMKRTEHCRIENNRFVNLGGNAIYLEGYNFRNRIAHNRIHLVGANGICLIGSLQQHPLFNEVTDNDIHHCGTLLKQVAGVYLGLSDGNRIAHNSIHHMPHHAINLGSNGHGRNLVEYNEIRFIALESMDTGAINSWGDVPLEQPTRDAERCGHVIRFNLIADPIGCRLDTLSGVITAPDPTFTNGIYLDDYTSNCFVYGNIILRSGIGIMIHGGKNNFCENNLLVDCVFPIRFFDSASERPANWQMPRFLAGNVFARNIIYSPQGGPIILNLGYQFTDKVIAQSDENLYWHGSAGDYRVEDPARHLRYTLPEWKQLGYDQHSLIADPLFADPSNEDFTLPENSPARQLGFQPFDLTCIGIRPKERLPSNVDR